MAKRGGQVFKQKARERVSAVHRLSARYNRQAGKSHEARLLELMRHHIDEIEVLMRQRQRHGLVETGDLVVLCLELLLEHRVSPDEILLKCFGRYERKLTALLEEQADERNRAQRRPNK